VIEIDDVPSPGATSRAGFWEITRMPKKRQFKRQVCAQQSRMESSYPAARLVAAGGQGGGEAGDGLTPPSVPLEERIESLIPLAVEAFACESVPATWGRTRSRRRRHERRYLVS
jgi:hypothetical protein